jgi:hypothetical protein
VQGKLKAFACRNIATPSHKKWQQLAAAGKNQKALTF